MPVISYGLLVYKVEGGQTMVLLAHPSGPFFASKDNWTIPKGEPDHIEEPLTTARREFSEETGLRLPDNCELIDLGELRQSSVKTNHIWALNCDPDLNAFSSNTFELEWPPHSGRRQTYYEIDRVNWFDAKTAKTKLFPSQRDFIDRLMAAL
ncbi:MAG: NUDIX domain-containing protein [Candidatus Saccharimonadales bacterium]